MDIFSTILIVLGLILFEAVNGIDNAVINAEVLSTMKERARRFFMTWGIFFAVFVVRGALPWLIVFLTIPSLGFLGSFTATFSNDPTVVRAIEQSAPMLLLGSGVFLLFLFLHWLFFQQKYTVLEYEKFLMKRGEWFYVIVSVLLVAIIGYALEKDVMLAVAAVIGSAAFFITHGFKKRAGETEKKLIGSGISDLRKILYLEIIDMSFSIDGVLGAFAFTISVPLILLGNGLGAIIVRQLTAANIERVKKYVFLKNGSMYSIWCLSWVMIAEGFGIHVPEWFAPALTFVIVGFFFRKSQRKLVLDTILRP